jgi:hypothetical protein
MNKDAVDRIARAVLYEGYLLYPYRTSSVKNRQRWTFGGLYPRTWSEAQGGSDAPDLLTECLIHGTPETRVEVRVRFLHLLERSACGEESRQEAVEREAAVTELSLGALLAGGHTERFAFPASQERDGEAVRKQEAVEGVIEVAAVNPSRSNPSRPAPLRGSFRTPRRIVPTAPSRAPEGSRASGNDPAACSAERGEKDKDRSQKQLPVAQVLAPPLPEAERRSLFQLQVRVANTTSLAGPLSRDEALMHSLISTHVVLGARDGAFVSLMDPPEGWREAAAGCRNVGVWPVLVGDEGDRDTMLAAPIILYDYPRIAPESPGDLFDGTEIDEILTLRILTLTESEKQEVSSGDALGRDLLARTEALAREQLLGLHGTFRGLEPVRDQPGEES